MNPELVSALEAHKAKLDSQLAAYDAVFKEREATILLIEAQKKTAATPATTRVRVRLRPTVQMALISRNGKGHGLMSRLVEEAISRQTGEFTVNDLAKDLISAGTPLTNLQISSVLSRLKGKEIKVAYAGKGSEPNRYERKEAEAG